MSIAIWKPGRRLFSTAAACMILTATAHTVGNLSSYADAEEQRVYDAMAGLHLMPGSSMNPTLMDVYWCLVFAMSITFLALGFINLVLAAGADVPNRALRRISWVNLLWVSAFVVMGWFYRVPPLLISAIAIEVSVAGSLITLREPQ